MSSGNVFCFTCESEQRSSRSEEGEARCAACNSEFCELIEGTRPPAPDPAVAANRNVQLSAFTIGSAPSGAQLMIIQETIPAGATTRLGGLQPLGDYATQEGLEQILARLMQSYQPPRQPTAANVIERLPRLQVPPFKSDEWTEASAEVTAEGDPSKGSRFACVSPGEACTVCHDCFVPKEEVVQLPCHHCFHEACITPWLKEHNTCPVCRFKFEEEDAQTAPQSQSRSRQTPSDAPPVSGTAPAEPPSAQSVELPFSTAFVAAAEDPQEFSQEYRDRLLRRFLDLGRELRAMRRASSEQLRQLLQNSQQGGGQEEAGMPLAQMSEQLSRLQSEWAALRRELLAVDARRRGASPSEAAAEAARPPPPRSVGGMFRPPQPPQPIAEQHQSQQQQLQQQILQAQAFGLNPRLILEHAQLNNELASLRQQQVDLQRNFHVAREQLMAEFIRRQQLLQEAAGRGTESSVADGEPVGGRPTQTPAVGRPTQTPQVLPIRGASIATDTARTPPPNPIASSFASTAVPSSTRVVNTVSAAPGDAANEIRSLADLTRLMELRFNGLTPAASAAAASLLSAQSNAALPSAAQGSEQHQVQLNVLSMEISLGPLPLSSFVQPLAVEETLTTNATTLNGHDAVRNEGDGDAIRESATTSVVNTPADAALIATEISGVLPPTHQALVAALEARRAGGSRSVSGGGLSGAEHEGGVSAAGAESHSASRAASSRNGDGCGGIVHRLANIPMSIATGAWGLMGRFLGQRH